MSELVKVRLLNDGGYIDTFYGVTFPVETVGAFYCFYASRVKLISDELIIVGRDEIINIPGAAPSFKGDDLSFFVGTECEIIND